MVTQVSGEVEVVEENRVLRAFKAVDLVVERRMVTLEWVASPVNGKFCFLFYSKFSCHMYLYFWFNFRYVCRRSFMCSIAS